MHTAYFVTEPDAVSYLSRPDGKAEVYLRRNITPYETEEGSGWKADEVFFETMLSEEEVAAQFDSYFIDEPETTIGDLVDAIDILTQIILEG